MTLYEAIREEMLGKNEDGTIPVWKAVVGGCVAGMTAQFLASPADLVKVQVQMEGRRRLQGLEPRVKNARHAFAKIYLEGGLKGLWKGWMPNVQRYVWACCDLMCVSKCLFFFPSSSPQSRLREPGRPDHLRLGEAPHTEAHLPEGQLLHARPLQCLQRLCGG